MGDPRRVPGRDGRPAPRRLRAGAALRGRDHRRLARARPARQRQQVTGRRGCVHPRAPRRDGERPACRHAAGCAGASRLPGGARAARVSGLVFAAAGGDCAGRAGSRRRLSGAGRAGVARGHAAGAVGNRADDGRRGAPPQSTSRPSYCTPAATPAPTPSARAAASARRRRYAPAATWSMRSIRWAGRSSGCANCAVPAGSTTATRCRKSAAT